MTKLDDNMWIPCSERLQKVHEDVLLSFRGLGICIGFLAETDGYFYVHECNTKYSPIEEVLAWMPLPEPYRENNENKNKSYELTVILFTATFIGYYRVPKDTAIILESIKVAHVVDSQVNCDCKFEIKKKNDEYIIIPDVSNIDLNHSMKFFITYKKGVTVTANSWEK